MRVCHPLHLVTFVREQFQDVTMRLIAVRMLEVFVTYERQQQQQSLEQDASIAPAAAPAGRNARSMFRRPNAARASQIQAQEINVYVQGELANNVPTLPPPYSTFHVYCSPANPGAVEVMRELAQTLGVEVKVGVEEVSESGATQRRRSSLGERRRSSPMLVSTSLGQVRNRMCDRMCVYLDARTWTRLNDMGTSSASNNSDQYARRKAPSPHIVCSLALNGRVRTLMLTGSNSRSTWR